MQKEFVDEKLTGFSRFIQDGSYRPFKKKEGGQESKSELGGVYQTSVGNTNYYVLFKQGRNDGETLSEFIASKFYNYALHGFGASVFLATKNSETKTKVVNKQKLHSEIYIGSVFFQEFKEIYKIMNLKDRPIFLQTFHDKKAKNFVTQYKNSNLGEVLAVSLWLGDYDTHIANLGLANVEGNMHFVKIDHGWSFAEIQNQMDYKKVPWSKINGFGKPTNHFADYDYGDFYTNPNYSFAQKLYALKQINREDIRKILILAFNELQMYYSFSAFEELAHWIGFPKKNQISIKNLIQYLEEKLYLRAISGIESLNKNGLYSNELERNELATKVTLKLISYGYGLGRLTEKSLDQYDDYVLKEVKHLENPSDPDYNFFGKDRDAKGNRSLYYNPRTGQQEFRHVSGIRGEHTNRAYSKKLSTTLIRPDGNTAFYGNIENPVGFIHNLFQVHNKNWKYVFKSNAYTNSKWWVGNQKINNMYLKDVYKDLYIEIDQLRNELLNHSKEKLRADNYNEILVGLNAHSLCGMFSPLTEAKNILNLASAYLAALKILKKDFLPTFVFGERSRVDRAIKRSIIHPLTLEELLDVLTVEIKRKSKEFLMFHYTLFQENYDSSKINSETYITQVRSILYTKFIHQSQLYEIENYYNQKLNEAYSKGLRNIGQYEMPRQVDIKPEIYVTRL
ncbi:hypothetical protein ACWNT8_06845 [Pigmentibacter ruber]